MASIVSNGTLFGIGKDFAEAAIAASQADEYSRYRGTFSAVRISDDVIIDRRYVSRITASDTQKALRQALDDEGYRLVSFSWQACN